jgi:predicted transcriptional regulator
MNLADSLWELMRNGKYYSILDLARLSGQPGTSVSEVVRFLTEYGFIRRIGTIDPVFTRSTVFSPRESMKLLECIADA